MNKNLSGGIGSTFQGPHGFVIWFTGLSGSGKTTLSKSLYSKLNDKGLKTICLDGDDVRRGLCSDLEFDLDSRGENIRRISEVCKILTHNGINVITSFISPLVKDRQQASNIIGDYSFREIYLDCPLEVCEGRDVKGLYERARKGEITNFTGISSPYEVPHSPYLKVKTSDQTIEESVSEIYNQIISDESLKLIM